MAETTPPLTATVRTLPNTIPFVSPEAIERRRGDPFRIRLGANESCFGPSPTAVQAMQEAVATSWCYGDPEGLGLRRDLAAHWNLTEACIGLGAGIDGLLQLIVRMTVTPGTPVVTSAGAYPTFNYHVDGFGGERKAVPYRDDKEDLTALLEAAHTHRPPLVYLSNPDNPMGTWHKASDILAFAAELPAKTWLILDEAYAEFAPATAIPAVDPATYRIIRLRTFSKVYGLAGQRIGYAIAHPDVIAALNKIRNHFEVNRVGQIGARTALADTAYRDSVAAAVAEGRQDYARLAQDLGFTAIPSATNFVAIDVGGEARARWLLQALEAADIFIRMPGIAPLNRCIRVTVGPPAARAIFEAAFREAAARLPAED